MTSTYRALTGRVFDLKKDLSSEEREFLNEVIKLYSTDTSWAEFSRAWIDLGRAKIWTDGEVRTRSAVYRICQDLAARLGISEGRIAKVGYREILSDLIDVRFRSRYEFCNQVGIDQAHLSRVLSGRSHFSPEVFLKILDVFGISDTLVFQPAFREDDLGVRLRLIDTKIDALETLRERSKNFPPEMYPNLIGRGDLVDDHLDPLRARVESGEDFLKALNDEQLQAYREKERIARQMQEEASRGAEVLEAC